jgi:methylenetetrahydrofolate--tRNA-(uracil-5-)-methyltransferase
MTRDAPELTVIGGGLAGSEAALAAANRGVLVELVEMRPTTTTPAHRTGFLAELVCSNSLGSSLPDRAGGLLKDELRLLGCELLAVAEATAVPAGGALAVDRDGFAEEVTRRVEAHPGIRLRREEATSIPASATIVATGPLTSDALAAEMASLVGQEYLYFYDALSPIVEADSIDMSVAFRGSRFGRGADPEGDYINCPMDEGQYRAFVAALLQAERIELRDFERDARYFEGCLPVEVMAARGADALAFGPMRPIGLRDPRTDRRPHAVVQLRQDDMAGSLFNIVGFQTNLTWPEQRRVLAMIPGLGRARFARLGQMHRNTYLNAPALLDATLQYRGRGDVFFAGQIVGIEGYMGNIASGLVAGVNAARVLRGAAPHAPPPATMLGALLSYVAHTPVTKFQPIKAMFGLLPTAPGKGKAERKAAQRTLAIAEMERWLTETGWSLEAQQTTLSGSSRGWIRPDQASRPPVTPQADVLV